MSQENVELARRWFDEVWNQRRGETIDELLTPESVCFAAGPPMQGPDEFRNRVHRPFLAALPDLHLQVEGTVAQGDQVVVRWIATGTHTGDGFGLPPTGRAVQFRGMTWIRFQGQKMVEGWDCWDQTGLIESLRAPA